jgi:hypothetical protein
MTTLHDGRCRCDACAIHPAADPLNKRQRQILVEFEARLAVAVATQSKAHAAYDEANRARNANIAAKWNALDRQASACL